MMGDGNEVQLSAQTQLLRLETLQDCHGKVRLRLTSCRF
jgi:hypothetical protein